MESNETTNSETLDPNHQISEHDHQADEDNNNPSITETEDPLLSSTSSSISQTEILRAVEVVERNSIAVSDSFSSLFASLRTALSEVTSSSVDHVQCFNDAAGRLQESALDSATKGNLYINSCLRLNEEMRGIDTLAMQFLFFLLVVFVYKPRTTANFDPNVHEASPQALDAFSKVLRRNVDALDTAVSSLVRLH